MLPLSPQPGTVKHARQSGGRNSTDASSDLRFRMSFEAFPVAASTAALNLLRVKRVPQCKCGAKRPALPLQRHHERWRQIEPANQRSRSQPGLRKTKLPEFRRLPSLQTFSALSNDHTAAYFLTAAPRLK